MNAVISSLEENLRKITLIAEPTSPAFTKDRGNTGDAKELTVQEFIASYLTSDYQIKKGCIYSKTDASKNIDCVVLFPNHPRLITPLREVIIAEGVYAAIEVKPDISTLTDDSEFYRGLLQIQSVKRIERKRFQIGLHNILGGSQPSAYFDKIPSIIFSFKSQELKKIIDFLRIKVKEKKISNIELPDIIISIDRGILFYCPFIKETIFKPFLDHLCSSYPDKVIVEISLLGPIQLTWFLRLFLSLPAPAMTLSENILHDYLQISESDNQMRFHTLDEKDLFIHK